jgi:hypothetical protein
LNEAYRAPNALDSAATQLVSEAVRQLADAEAAIVHTAGRRERFRVLVARAIAAAERALALADEERPRDERQATRTVTAARVVLAKCHAASARDALHGAGQLSQSAQRAPTCEACDAGWQRVASLVSGAEASAQIATAIATELERESARSSAVRAARAAVSSAENAARAGRELLATRNHAYTFHTGGGFSFGEGWYLAAAAVLAGVEIQIEPNTPGTAAAEAFLREAGLVERIQPYRPRPRAMKHTTALVARAFRADPVSAQRRLRAAFLGTAPVASDISDYIDRRVCGASSETTGKKVLLWIRDGVHHSGRNTLPAELLALTTLVQRAGLVPIWTGDAMRGPSLPDGVVDTVLFWKEPMFQRTDRRRAQLQFFEDLKARHGLIGQLGVTTAGMDGPALMGLPTLYLTELPNVRMREWVGAVPGYTEVVRENGYLERVARVLGGWL